MHARIPFFLLPLKPDTYHCWTNFPHHCCRLLQQMASSRKQASERGSYSLLATTQEKWDLCAWNILHSTTTGPRTHRKLRDSFSSLKENWHKISDISPPTLILLLLCMPTFGNCLPLPGIRPLVSRTIHGFYPCHSIFAKLLIFLFPMICFK